MENKYMKLGEAIKYSGLSRSTLHKYDKLGILVALRTPTSKKLRLYTREMFDDFFKQPKAKRLRNIKLANQKKD